MSAHSRALATQSQNALACFRNSKGSSSQILSSLKLDNQPVRSPQLELELAQLNRPPVRRTRYLPELDMEIEIIEAPRKSIVNKDLRVRALREHWDERGVDLGHRRSYRPQPLSPLRTEVSKPRA